MSGQIVGYARTSTADQVAGFEAQLRDLEKVGAQKIFREQVSSVAERAQLEALLDYIREGDTVVVTKLDRLARSVKDLITISERIEAKKAALRILDMSLDTSKPNGRMMMTVFGAVAQFEREVMLERQKEGIVAAKAAGKFRGRAPTVERQRAEIEALLETLGPTDVAAKLNVARSSVYRIAAEKIKAQRDLRARLVAGDTTEG